MQTIGWKKNKVRIIDQTKLPEKLVYLNLSNPRQLWWAVKKLKVRGAPAIGIAAALGIVLGMRSSGAKNFAQFNIELKRLIGYFKKVRPTAANLSWALERMKEKVQTNSYRSVVSLKKLLLSEALQIIREDKKICRQIARLGSKLIKNGDIILTHCNAGALATADYGTALGIIYETKRQGKKIKVYADETRPVLQGARLTTWELMQRKIDVTLICDNMAADLMQRGKINKILVGADRVAANGDAANKIGTYNLAVLARYHRIPFYVVAPISSFDLSLKSGKDIPIEHRDPQEIREVFGKLIAPRKVKVYNPAFDVTPHYLISAIVTERGIFYKPYKINLRKLIKN